MNATPSEQANAELREAMRELMNRYDHLRREWVRQMGTPDGFDAWFTERFLSAAEPNAASAAAAVLGKRGGARTSDRKAASSRANGRKGGRPRKNKEETA